MSLSHGVTMTVDQFHAHFTTERLAAGDAEFAARAVETACNSNWTSDQLGIEIQRVVTACGVDLKVGHGSKEVWIVANDDTYDQLIMVLRRRPYGWHMTTPLERGIGEAFIDMVDEVFPVLD